MSIKTAIYKLEAEKIFNEAFESSIVIFNETIEHFTNKYYEVNKMSYTKVLCGLDYNFKNAKEKYFNYILKKECDRRTKKLKRKYCIIPNPCRIIELITSEVSPNGFKIEEL